MTNSIKTTTITNTFWKFAERFLAQGVSLIVSIVIARILIPEDYSVVSLVTIFFTFSNVIISGGLNTALIQKKNADNEDYSTILFISVFLSVLIYLILFFCAPWISNLFHQPSLILIIRIMGLTLPVNAIKSIWCAYISSSLKFKKFFFATLGGTLVSAVIGIVMAIKGYGPWALVAQQMSNTVIDTIILVLITRIGIVPRINKNKFKELFSYGWKILVSSLIATIYTELVPLIIGIRYEKDDLSFYTKGKSFPTTISSTVTYTLSAVIFPVIAKQQDNKEIVLEYTRKFMRIASFIMLPIMLGFFSIADNFIYVVLTEKWLSASYFIKLFCIVSIADIIAVGNCETIKAIGKSGTYLIMEIIKKSCYFITIILFTIFSNNPQILAISALVCSLVSLVVNAIPNKKIIGYKYRDQFLDLLPNIILSLLMVGSVYLVKLIFKVQFGLVLLIVEILAGAIVYFGLAFLSKNKTFFYLLNSLKGFLKKDEK